jgi:hypothetical protein
VKARRRRPLAFACLLTAVGLAPSAGAVGAPLLDLALAGCAQYDEARLRELVFIEMGTVSAEGARRRAQVRLTCTGERVAIDVVDGGAAQPSRSELNLAGTAEATRLRLLALTITELVSLSWHAATASTPPPPSMAPASPVAPTVTTDAPALLEKHRWALSATTSVRRMGRPATWLAGVGLGGTRSLGQWAALALDLRAESGDATTSVAGVGWRQVSATAGLALGFARGRWAWHALPGFSIGMVRLSATPTATDARGATLGAVWTGPSLALRVRRALGQSGFVELEAGGGLVTRRVVGLLDGRSPLLEVQGPWALAGLAAGLVF